MRDQIHSADYALRTMTDEVQHYVMNPWFIPEANDPNYIFILRNFLSDTQDRIADLFKRIAALRSLVVRWHSLRTHLGLTFQRTSPKGMAHLLKLAQNPLPHYGTLTRAEKSLDDLENRHILLMDRLSESYLRN